MTLIKASRNNKMIRKTCKSNMGKEGFFTTKVKFKGCPNVPEFFFLFDIFGEKRADAGLTLNGKKNVNDMIKHISG